MHAAGKIFVKTYLKAIRDTFFLKMWNFPICDILSNRRGKFKPSDLQGNPSITQFPRLVEYHDLLMRKTLRVVGLLLL